MQQNEPFRPLNLHPHEGNTLKHRSSVAIPPTIYRAPKPVDGRGNGNA